ncbi:phage minor head protein [Tsukamurella sp. DT100]|uniref:phage minor head protein n=1 Tax=Tsukamurella sp. DT100 TaxID=3393415 RepID=UPI003CEDF2D1
MRPDRAAEHRFAAWHRKVTAERDLTAVVLAGMDLWRIAVYTAITEHQPNREQILAGGFFQHLWRLDNAAAAARTWLRWVDGAVAPSISAVFGEAFNTVRKTATISPQPYEAAHMATVHDRLVIWPDGAFEELRPELEEALSEAESIGQVQDRVGAILGIDKMTREHRARINEINRILDDPDADPADLAELLAQKAQLWRDHDASLEEWEWMARRIARTEVQGAVEAGQYEAARASESQLGITLWKRWIATPDTRTRHSHWLADGQAVRLAERFTVGTAQLLYPADPSSGAASEIINCRCSLAYWERDELQAELQGPDGSIGEVVPQGVRLGPDDPAVVDAKVAELEAADDQHTDTRAEDWAPPLTSAGPRRVRDSDYWGAPTETPIVRGMRPARRPIREPGTRGHGVVKGEFRGSLPKRAPSGSEDLARAYRDARRADPATVHPPAEYTGAQQATVEELRQHGRISPPDDPLVMAVDPPDGRPDENVARMAAALALNGEPALTIADLANKPGLDFEGKSADFLLTQDGRLVEVKRLDGNDKTVLRELRRAREQARHVYAELPSRDSAQCEALMKRFLGNAETGPHLDELYLFGSDGAVYWQRD